MRILFCEKGVQNGGLDVVIARLFGGTSTLSSPRSWRPRDHLGLLANFLHSYAVFSCLSDILCSRPVNMANDKTAADMDPWKDILVLSLG